MKKINNHYSAEEIDYTLDMGGFINNGLADALALLPKKIVDFAISKCAILTPELNSDGSTWNLDWRYINSRKWLIIISPKVWNKSSKKRAFIVAHEIAHAYLKHKVMEDITDDKQHEMDADTLAIEWLSGKWSKKELLKICKYLGADKPHIIK